MKQQLAKELAGSSNALTAAAGAGSTTWGALEYWNFVNTNAAGLGIIITVFFGFVAIGFNIYNSVKQSQVVANKAKLDEHIKETKTEFKSVKNQLNKILDKIT